MSIFKNQSYEIGVLPVFVGWIVGSYAEWFAEIDIHGLVR